MGKFLLVLFPNETRGLWGLSALERLHRERRVSLRGAALLERDADGLLLLRKDSSGLLLDGGLGATVARAPRGLLAFLASDLEPKTFALVAEVAEGRIPPLDHMMAPLGGRMFGEWRADPGDDAPERRACASTTRR